ncbi:MAG: hypothetical protein MUP47_07500 [Phycisphaerae bacterium]|nr:hypothetical protein [Phycisphaerae bacterium]
MNPKLIPNREVPFWALEQLKLRAVVAGWVDDEVALLERSPFAERFAALDGHALDEAGGISRSWVGFYFLTGDQRIPAYLTALRDAWKIATADHMHHGYPANPHGDHILHTAETFTHFLLNMLYLDRADRQAAEMIEDAAEHLGNWCPGVYPWYDWDAHRFRSYFLGTRSEAFAREPLNWQSIIHFRLLAIAVGAYEATGKQRYLDLLTDYSDMWAEVILSAPSDRDIPRVFTDLSEAELSRYAAQDRRSFHPRRDWVHEYGGVLASRVPLPPGAVPGDLVSTLLEVYRYTGRPAYKDALHRVVKHWIGADRTRPGRVPTAQPHASDYYLKYRDFTGDTSLDSLYLEQFPVGVAAAVLSGQPDRMLGVATASAAVFDHLLASNSGRWGAGRVVTHGCDVRSNAGGACAYVMPALHLPVFGGMTVQFGRPPWMNVAYYTDGHVGLPADVAAFCVPGPGARRGVTLCNAGSTAVSVTVRLISPAARDRGDLKTPPPADGRGVMAVTLQPLETVTVLEIDRGRCWRIPCAEPCRGGDLYALRLPHDVAVQTGGDDAADVLGVRKQLVGLDPVLVDEVQGVDVPGVDGGNPQALGRPQGLTCLVVVLVAGVDLQGIGQDALGEHLRRARPAERVRQHRQAAFGAGAGDDLGRLLGQGDVGRIVRPQHQHVLHPLAGQRHRADLHAGEDAQGRELPLNLSQLLLVPDRIVLGEVDGVVPGLDESGHRLLGRGPGAGAIAAGVQVQLDLHGGLGGG